MARTNEAKYAQIVQKRFSALQSDHQEIFEEAEIYKQMYRSYMNESDAYPWDYQLVDPIIFGLIKSMMARLNPEHMTVDLEARNSKAYGNKDANQKLVNWELSEMGKTLSFYYFILRGLLSGRGYLQSGWLYNKAIEIDPGKGKSRKIFRDIINRGDVKNVKFQDILVPNRNIPILEQQPYIIQRMTMRFGEMIDENEAREEEIWKEAYLDKIAEGRLFTNKVEYGADLPIDDGEKINRGSSSKKYDSFMKSQYVALLKMQTLDGEVFYVPEKENEWVLNKNTDNEFWHGHYDLISWTPFPEDDEYFSLGMVQPIADLQIAASSTLNQFLTLVRKNANPMWLAGSAAAATPDWMFVNRPDGIIRIAGDAGQVQQVTTKDNGGTLIEARRELATSIEKATNISSLYTSGAGGGSSPQVNKTATGARVIDSNIDINIQMIVSLFGAQALSKLGEHLLELNAQFITEEQEFRITGKRGASEYVRVQPEEITANFEVIAKPETLLKESAVVRQAALLNMKTLMDQEKDVAMDKVPVWDAIIDSYPEMNNVGDVILDPVRQAEKAIDEVMKGVIPETRPNDDHKTIIKIVQRYIIDCEEDPEKEPLNEEELSRFAEFLDDHRKWIEAEKDPNLVTQQPEEPSLMPTNEQQLIQSMTGGEGGGNPLADQPVPINQADIGGMPTGEPSVPGLQGGL